MASSRMPKGKHYKKDKKISILTKRANPGPEPGETTAPIQNGDNVWAYYRHSTTEEYRLFGVDGYKVEAVFRINWRDNIDETMIIRFRGNDYEIIQIDDFEGYKKDLTIFANVINPD